MVDSHFKHIDSFTLDMFTPYEEKALLAQGELLSTAMFQLLLEEQGVSSRLIPALEFMRIDEHSEPKAYYD